MILQVYQFNIIQSGQLFDPISQSETSSSVIDDFEDIEDIPFFEPGIIDNSSIYEVHEDFESFYDQNI